MQIPRLGFGTWQLLEDQATEAVASAIDLGYRHLDCAHIYDNESYVGAAIQQKIETGQVTREELWVTSKLWNDSHRGEHVRPALETTLRHLQLEFLDLYLIHWPVALRPGKQVPESAEDFLSLEEVPLIETWTALEECCRAGLCRHIGVSNFNRVNIQQLIDYGSLHPFANQVESHPFLQQPELFQYCRDQDIEFIAYSPLGAGARPEHMRKGDEPSLADHPVIGEIAESHQATPQQILLAWSIQRGAIPIPKAANPLHQEQNLAAGEINLTADQMQQIGELDRGYRFIDGTFWTDLDGPYTLENLWQS